MPRYEYLCKCGELTGRRGGYEDEVIACPACGQPARRRPFYAAGSIITATGGRFYPDPHRFLDRAQDIDYAYQRAEQEVGGYLRRGRDFEAGVVRARARLLEEGTKAEQEAIFGIAERMDAHRAQ